MVGDVHDLGQFGDCLHEEALDSLLQRDAGEAATLASAAELDICNGVIDADELGCTAVSCDRRVDVLVQNLLNTFGKRTCQISDRGCGRHRGRRRVGVVDRKRWIGRVAAHREFRILELVDILGRDDHSQLAVSIDVVRGLAIIEGNETQFVYELTRPDPRDLDEEGELTVTWLTVPDLDDLGDGIVGDVQNGSIAAHGCSEKGLCHRTRSARFRQMGKTHRIRKNAVVPHVVLILPTATYRAADFMAAAQGLDLEITVASERPQMLGDAMGDGFLLIDCSRPEEAAESIAELAHRTPLDAVIAVDDEGVLVAALASERLGLPHNPAHSVAATRNKVMLRRALREQVPQPPYQVAEPGTNLVELARHVGVPLVIKPLSLSGSRGVIRIDDPTDAIAVVQRIRRILARAGRNPNEPLLFERFIPGLEVALEGVVRDGQLNVLAIFDKPDPLDGPFFEESIYVTPSRLHPDMQAEVATVTQQAIDALELKVGPIHAELRVDGPWARMIEIAARPIGGLCGRALRFGLMGSSLETLLLRAALDMPLRGLRREDPAAGVMMISIPANGILDGVSGLEAARATAAVTGVEITVTAGSYVETLPEGDRYLGFIFARAGSPGEVESALRRAHAQLDIRIRPTGDGPNA